MTEEKRARRETTPEAPADYIPQSAAYYSPDDRSAIAARARNARFSVNRGHTFSNRSLGRTQSLPSVFSTTQEDLETAKLAVAEGQRLLLEQQRIRTQRELMPMWNNSDIQQEYNANLSKAKDNPFEAQGGLSFDVDMDQPSTASPSKKRTQEDVIEEETESQELAFNAGTLHLDTEMQTAGTSRRYMPAKRKLGKTQSLPAGSLFFD